MSDDLIGRYQELPFPLARTATIDTVRIGKTKRHVPILLEVDVTAARESIAARKRGGDDITFTGWAVKCVAQAAGEHNSSTTTSSMASPWRSSSVGSSI